MEPVFPRDGLEVADEINEHHREGRKNRGRSEGRDEKGEGGEDAAFDIDQSNCRKQIEVEPGVVHEAQGVIALVRCGIAHLERGFAKNDVLAPREDENEQGAHDNEADREQGQYAHKFAGQIVESRNGFREDRVDGSVLRVLRKQPGGCDHREERGEQAHCPECEIFQHLEFLLKAHLRHENRAADEKQCEEKDNVENLKAGQPDEGVAGNGSKAPDRDSAIWMTTHRGPALRCFSTPASWFREIAAPVTPAARRVL